MAKRMNITLMTLAVALPMASGEVNPTQAPNPVPPAPAAEVVASRLLTAVDPQLVLLRSRLAINGNERGPFGLFQDPDKAADQVMEIPIGRPEKVLEAPFKDVVAAVPVSMVMPSEQEFLVEYSGESRRIRTGDEFPLVVNHKEIKVRVERVRMSGVRFRNLKTGETAEKAVDFLPEGVIKSAGGSVVPAGVTSQREASRMPLPLDLRQENPTNDGRSR